MYKSTNGFGRFGLILISQICRLKRLLSTYLTSVSSWWLKFSMATVLFVQQGMPKKFKALAGLIQLPMLRTVKRRLSADVSDSSALELIRQLRQAKKCHRQSTASKPTSETKYQKALAEAKLQSIRTLGRTEFSSRSANGKK